MARPYYSRRHYDRVCNVGTGNPALTSEQKIKVWEDIIRAHANNPEVVATCQQLITIARKGA